MASSGTSEMSTKMFPVYWGIGYSCALLFAYFPVFSSLVSMWSHNEEYSHGFLVAPISLYLLWRKRDDLALAQLSSNGWGFVVVLLSLCLYIFSYYAEITTLSAFSLIPLLAGTVLYVLGFGMLKKVAFPLCFLVFMIPVPSQILAQVTMPLQLLVSKVSSLMAAGIGIPLLREGNVIHLPQQTLQVVQACSGLMSMISLWMLSAIIGYFTLNSKLLRVILLLAATPIAVFVNIVRVFLLIFCFYNLGMDLTRGSVHTLYGMVIFILSILSVLLVRGILAKWDNHPSLEPLSS
jgi:exosortase A